MMAARKIPSPDILRKLLDYDPETGVLTWKRRSVEWFINCKNPSHAQALWNGKHAGCVALTDIRHGYIRGTVLGRSVRAHRVSWALFHGDWPEMCIDHVNGDRSDNRISNLRESTKQQNAWNSTPRSGTSKFKGVSWHKSAGKWVAQIRVHHVNGEQITARYKHLGVFRTEQEAARAYDLAAVEFHGEFARTNEMMGLFNG
jgi:hypothetical protein